MKTRQFMGIAAPLAVVALLAAGCSGAGDDPKGPVDEPYTTTMLEAFTVTHQGRQDKALVTIDEDNNSVTFTLTGSELWGELLTPAGARWDVSGYTGIELEYTSTGKATIFIQDTDSIFIFGINDSNGWGAVSKADNWETLTLPFSILQWQDWFGTDHDFGTLEVVKVCFQVTDGPNAKKFEIRNFTAY